MTAPSPATAASALVTSIIKSNGKEIDQTIEVLSIDIWLPVNKVPRARIVMYDGSAAQADFPISDQPTFLPGAEVEISAGDDGKNTVLFKGLVIRQGIDIGQSGASKLIVDLSDKALKMTLARHNKVYQKITDGDLIGKLITASGLTKSVAATTPVMEEIVQYYATNWDLMLTRAEVNGLVVIADAGTVTVKAPDTTKAPALTVTYGESILDLRTELNATTQYKSSAVSSSTWDDATQAVIQAAPGSVDVADVGNVSSDTLASVFNISEYPQVTGALIDQPSLKNWSTAFMLKSKLSKVRGAVSFQGSSLAKTGGTIALAGVGTHFTGTVWVSCTHHSITNGNWITACEFGLGAPWFAAEADHIAAPEASGLLPPINGLQTGVVKQVAKDPEGEFRVLVTLPLIDKAEAVWARLGTFYASNKVGAVFYPEIGDEVVVAFMNDDPRYPVIVGSLYSKKRPPPITPDDANDHKALVTRSKLEITFDDKDKIVEIKTPGGHSVTLSDKATSITIKDSNGNTLSMSKSGITIDSAAAVTIKAKTDVTVDAGANLKLSAKANAEMSGLQVAHKAQTKFSAQGSATAELTSSGTLTIRGTMVSIN